MGRVSSVQARVKIVGTNNSGGIVGEKDFNCMKMGGKEDWANDMDAFLAAAAACELGLAVFFFVLQLLVLGFDVWKQR